MSRIIRTTRFWLLGAVAATALAGTAYATIPAGDGIIHGCYAKSGGTLRVIDASVTNCKSGETALDWSQRGQPGPTGDPGAPGPAGPQGDPGAPGGLAGYMIVSTASALSAENSKSHGANCPAGKFAVGGGAAVQGDLTGIALDMTEPRSDGLGWVAQAHEIAVPQSTATWKLAVYAVCVDAA